MANRIPLTPAEIAAASPIQAVAGLTGDIAANTLQAALSLDNVTNHAQTRAAIVPNTIPAAGQVMLGNAGGTAYTPTTVSGDATISSVGVLTVTKTNGTSLGTMAIQDAGSVAITGGSITGLSSPSGSTDAATKGYVDGFVSSPMLFQGTLDCSTNPNYPSANKGDVYIVSAAGKVGGASGVAVDIGDMVVALVNNAGGNQATVGASWSTIEHNMQGALIAANNLSDLLNAVTARNNLGLEIGVDVLAVDGDGSSLSNVVNSIAGLDGVISGSTLKTTLSLDSVTNNAQTHAAIVPNTAPAAGRILVGNAGGTAYAPVAMSGDATLASTGAITVTKVGGINIGTMATQNANAVNITGGSITGLSLPTASADAATKGYVDGLISTPMSFKSSIDCSANPNYPAAQLGDVYVVSTAGKIGGTSGTNVDIGDMLIAIESNAGGTQAAVGIKWSIIEHNLQGALLAANNLSDIASAVTARSNLGLVIGTDVLAPDGSGAALTDVVNSVAGIAGTVTVSALKAALSLDAVTNDAQTKAAIVPNTAPAAGRILVGNAGGTAYAPVAMSGDATLAATGAITVTKTNGTLFGTMAVQDANDITVTGGSIAGSTLTNNTISGGTITGSVVTGLSSPSGSTDAATKGYVDGLITNPLSFQTSLNCSTNPNYPAATKGYVYVVSVAGKVGGASGINVDVGDLLLAIADNAGGNQAAVGSSWTIIEHNLQGALLAANNLSDITDAATARSNLGLVIGTNVLAPNGVGSALTGITWTVAGLSGAVSSSALRTALSISNVTNDAQTKAAVVPNTAPAAGRILVGNAGGTAYAPVAVFGDAVLASTGELTVNMTNGTEFGTMAVQDADSVTITGGSIIDVTITGLSTPTTNDEAATKGYVDDTVAGAVSCKGLIDCSTDPDYPAATIGDNYIVSVAGKIGGASGTVVEVGDFIIANATNAGGTQAAVGADWSVVSQSDTTGLLTAANNLSDITSASTARSNLGLVIGTNVLAPDGSGANLTNVVNSVASLTGDIVAATLTAALSLDALTNDTQTKAAIVPNTVPDAGELLIGNTGGTAYAPVAMSGDATIAHDGVITVTKTSGTDFGTMATQDADSVAITGGSITGISSPSASSDVATKGYVDGLVTNPMRFMGATDCSTNPNYPAGLIGDIYVVSASGKIGGASGINVDVGDMFIANTTNVGGTQAAVGSSWSIIEHNLQGVLLAANNLSDIANAATALSNLGGQAASGTLTATIADSTPTSLANGVLVAHNSDVDVIATSTSNRVLAYNTALGITWRQVSSGDLGSLIINNANIATAAAIDATKIADGSVTNAEFQCINSVTSNVQTQLNNKLASDGDGSALTGITHAQISGLGTMATQAANAVAITGGTITGLGTPSGSTDAATKGYVDGLLSSPMNFKSATDCSANPNYPTAIKGDTYVVSVAGKIGGASGITVEVGDLYLAIANNAGGTQASVGASWIVLEHNLQGALLAANNLSDVASTSAALFNLGGQPLSGMLTALSGINLGSAPANISWYWDGAVMQQLPVTAASISLLDDTSTSAMRTTLGLVIGTDIQAYNADLGGIATLNTNGIPVRTSAGTYAARTITGTANVITVTDGNGVGGNPTLTVGSLVQCTDTTAVLTKQQNFGAVALTSSGASIAWNLDDAQSAKHTLTENTTLANPTNMVDGGTYVLRITQHASSPKTLAFGSAYKWSGGAPTISATNGAVDIITFTCNGTHMYGSILKAFA